MFKKYNYCYHDSLKDTFAEFISSDILEDFTYLFSFLKSLSIREGIYGSPKKGFLELQLCFDENEFPFFHTQKELLDCYHRYLNEVSQKQKNLCKKK